MSKEYYKCFQIIFVSFKASQVALVVKSLPANAVDKRDVESIPGLGRSPGVGYGNPLQWAERSLAGYSP